MVDFLRLLLQEIMGGGLPLADTLPRRDRQELLLPMIKKRLTMMMAMSSRMGKRRRKLWEEGRRGSLWSNFYRLQYTEMITEIDNFIITLLLMFNGDLLSLLDFHKAKIEVRIFF